MIVGVTGCPGSGKSVAAAAFASCGWRLIDADLLGRTVVEERREVIVALANAFGGDILRADGSLDRRLVATRAFATPETTARLNGIVHPVLIEQLLRDMSHTGDSQPDVVVDCALIFEWGIESRFDLVICVHADPECRIARIMARDGRSREDIERMFAAQLPEDEKCRRADLAIANNGSLERIGALSRFLCRLPGHLPRP